MTTLTTLATSIKTYIDNGTSTIYKTGTDNLTTEFESKIKAAVMDDTATAEKILELNNLLADYTADGGASNELKPAISSISSKATTADLTATSAGLTRALSTASSEFDTAINDAVARIAGNERDISALTTTSDANAKAVLDAITVFA